MATTVRFERPATTVTFERLIVPAQRHIDWCLLATFSGDSFGTVTREGRCATVPSCDIAMDTAERAILMQTRAKRSTSAGGPT